MLGIATVRQESWRTSVDNTNILEVEEVGPCLSLLASDHELGCNWCVMGKEVLISTEAQATDVCVLKAGS